MSVRQKYILLLYLGLIVIPLNLLPSNLLAQTELTTPTELWVEVKSTVLRKQPLPWAPSISELTYGSRVEVLERDKSWYRIKDEKGIEGYVHSSAVTQKKVILKPLEGDIKIEADRANIVLAGKGFSGEVEAQYSGDEKAGLNYTAVDCVEGKIACSDGKIRSISSEQLALFVSEGKLGQEF